MAKRKHHWEEQVPELKETFAPYVKYTEGEHNKMHQIWARHDRGYFAFCPIDPNIMPLHLTVTDTSDRLDFYCYETGVVVFHFYTGIDNEPFEDVCEMTHENCLAYLEQLPRPFYTFAKKGPPPKSLLRPD